MDFFTFDYTTTNAGIAPAPIIQTDSSSNFSNSVVVSSGDFTVGTGDGSNGGYTFEPSIGPQGYVLSSDVPTNKLVWVPNAGGGGGGDINNGGNSGPISIGTVDSTPLNLFSGGPINIGQVGSVDQILLNGSVGFQYDNITAALGTFLLTSDYFFIEVSNSGTNTVELPLSSTAKGRQYIISKNFPSPSQLTIITTGFDNIDGNSSLTLNVQNQRIKLISNGIDKWIIL